MFPSQLQRRQLEFQFLMQSSSAKHGVGALPVIASLPAMPALPREQPAAHDVQQVRWSVCVCALVNDYSVWMQVVEFEPPFSFLLPFFFLNDNLLSSLVLRVDLKNSHVDSKRNKFHMGGGSFGPIHMQPKKKKKKFNKRTLAHSWKINVLCKITAQHKITDLQL